MPDGDTTGEGCPTVSVDTNEEKEEDTDDDDDFQDASKAIFLVNWVNVIAWEIISSLKILVERFGILINGTDDKHAQTCAISNDKSPEDSNASVRMYSTGREELADEPGNDDGS